MILIEAAKLLSTPTGNFVYYLILVVTLALLFLLSQAYRSRQRSCPPLRWLITSGGLLSLHIVWIMLESIAMVSPVDGNPLAVKVEVYRRKHCAGGVWREKLPRMARPAALDPNSGMIAVR